jgi:hypothetical protein
MKIPRTRIEIVGHRPWSPKRQSFAEIRHAPMNARIGWFFREKFHLFEIRKTARAANKQPGTIGEQRLVHRPITWSTLGNPPAVTASALQNLPSCLTEMILRYVPASALFALKATSRRCYSAAEATLNSARRKNDRMTEIRAKLRAVAEDCRNNGLSIDHFKEEAKAIIDRTVTVEFNFADFSAEQRNALADILKKKTDLRYCRLVAASVDNQGFIDVAKAISKKTCVQNLQIDVRPAGEDITAAEMDLLCRLPRVTALFANNADTSRAFAPPEHATTLELVNCDLTRDKIGGFEGSTSIMTLNLKRNTRLADGDIGRIIRSQPSLKHVNIWNTRCGPGTLGAMREAGTLRSANLSYCSGVNATSIDRLNGHPSIEDLTLRGSDVPWSRLASLPGHLPRLQVLDASENRFFRNTRYKNAPPPAVKRLKLEFTNAGPEAAEYLAASTHTTELYLCGNDVGTRGAVALIGNGILRHLYLPRNNLRAAEQIVEAIRNANNLVSLDLRENLFYKTDLPRLLDAAKHNTSLKLLDLRGIDFQEPAYKLLELLKSLRDTRPDLTVLISPYRL